MRIVIDIPDDLAPVVVAILRNQIACCSEYDDDGLADATIMHDFNLPVSDYVQATDIVDSFQCKIEEALRDV